MKLILTTITALSIALGAYASEAAMEKVKAIVGAGVITDYKVYDSVKEVVLIRLYHEFYLSPKIEQEQLADMIAMAYASEGGYEYAKVKVLHPSRDTTIVEGKFPRGW